MVHSVRSALCATVVLALSGAVTNAEPVFVSGWDTAATNHANARSRAFKLSGGSGEQEHYLRTYNVANPLTDNKDFGAGRYVASNAFVFAYDANAETVAYTVTNSSGDVVSSLSFDSDTYLINYLQITLKDTKADADVRLGALSLNGNAFSLDQSSVEGTNSDWHMIWSGLASGFTLTGNILFSVSGSDGNLANEDPVVNFRMGTTDSAETIIPLPSASALAGLGLLGLGVRRRRGSL